MTSSTASGLRAPLLIAAAGAVIILLGFLGTWVELGGVVAIALGVLLAASYRDSRSGAEIAGVQWWRVLVTGAVISIVAWPLSLVLETIGGLIAGFGAALVIIGAAFGWPR